MGGMIGGLFGGGNTPSQPNVQVYQPTGTANIDSTLQGLLTNNASAVSQQNNPYTQYSPQFANLYNQIYNNPYQAGAQTGANNAGAGYTGVGNNSLMNSSSLSGAISPLLSNAQTVMNTAFDPQQALYSQNLQKVNDQSNVANAQYGLTGGQAAANTTQADSNFDISWQEQQLQNQLNGLQGYGQAVNQAGTGATAANNVGASGAGNVAQGGTVPYQQSVLGTTNQSTALDQYIQQLLGSVNSSQGTIANLGSYLGQGIGASTAGANAALGDYNAQLTNSANLGSGLGSAFNFLSSPTTANPSQSQFGSLLSLFGL